ncbi:MAG: DUF4783 domain-containing protein [Bacteroidetes bacterium]|jgi:hypothetical protein|nr:DUF4783 domain-containing protein [Bacteroidota bacterium]MBT6687529.1 DUF4783 domain-containing protein [Bacteroidota bacterium]MBT7142760.1 DUF4783 domain-containing protein [Bacteroidota bacterium]MBT7491963.1 DUF4783 domain-containing protein [Bacteroidota bacterium]
MNTIRKFLSVLILFFLSVLFCLSQDTGVSEKINNSIKTGDTKALARFFNSSIELVVLEKEDVYSKSQAELVVSNFFKKHKPLGFSVQHNGQSKDSKYTIGTLKTNEGNFRVYYLTKQMKNGNPAIFLLRIEKKDKF